MSNNPTTFVKLEILSGLDPEVPFASIADLSIIQPPT